MNLQYIPHTKDVIGLRVKWLNDPEINRFLGSKPTTTAKQQEWLKKYDQDRQKRFFTIVADDQLVGVVGLSHINEKKGQAEVFVMIGEVAYHGRGIGQQAVEYIKNYAVNELGLESLYLSVNQSNKPAVTVYTKAGFTLRKTLPDKEVEMIWQKDGGQPEGGPPKRH